MSKVIIEFFLKEVSLGKFPCQERSNQEDRDLIARDNGIMAFDKMILDYGRVIITRSDNYVVDKKGSGWNVKTADVVNPTVKRKRK